MDEIYSIIGSGKTPRERYQLFGDILESIKTEVYTKPKHIFRLLVYFDQKTRREALFLLDAPREVNDRQVMEAFALKSILEVLDEKDRVDAIDHLNRIWKCENILRSPHFGRMIALLPFDKHVDVFGLLYFSYEGPSGAHQVNNWLSAMIGLTNKCAVANLVFAKTHNTIQWLSSDVLDNFEDASIKDALVHGRFPVNPPTQTLSQALRDRRRRRSATRVIQPNEVDEQDDSDDDDDDDPIEEVVPHQRRRANRTSNDPEWVPPVSIHVPEPRNRTVPRARPSTRSRTTPASRTTTPRPSYVSADGSTAHYTRTPLQFTTMEDYRSNMFNGFMEFINANPPATLPRIVDSHDDFLIVPSATTGWARSGSANALPPSNVLRAGDEICETGVLQCEICLSRKRRWMFGCGHSYCGACSDKQIHDYGKRCPNCRKLIDTCIKFFMQ